MSLETRTLFQYPASLNSLLKLKSAFVFEGPSVILLVRFPDIAVRGDRFVVILTRGVLGGASFLMSNSGAPPPAEGGMDPVPERVSLCWSDLGDVATEFVIWRDGVVDGVSADSNGNRGISGRALVFFLTEGVTMGSKLYFLYVAVTSDEDDEEEDDELDDEDDEDDIDVVGENSRPPPLVPDCEGPTANDLALTSVGAPLEKAEELRACGARRTLLAPTTLDCVGECLRTVCGRPSSGKTTKVPDERGNAPFRCWTETAPFPVRRRVWSVCACCCCCCLRGDERVVLCCCGDCCCVLYNIGRSTWDTEAEYGRVEIVGTDDDDEVEALLL